jgi:hypothetical protein
METSVIPTVWVTVEFGLGRGSWNCGCWAKVPAASSSPTAVRIQSFFILLLLSTSVENEIYQLP